MDINIYSVAVLVPQDGKTRFVLHYVGGTSSADAERRILETVDAIHLEGRRFINTYRFVEDYPQPTRLYAGSLRDDPPMDDWTARRWIQSSTHDSDDDGETRPAAFREF